jgi:nitric oxide reductase NorD protein
MEWDQFLFYHGFKKLKALRKKLLPKSAYSTYRIFDEEKRIREFGLLTLGYEIRINPSDGRISLENNLLSFPEEVEVFENLEESSHAIHCLLAYLFLIQKKRLKNMGNTIVETKSQELFSASNYRSIMKEFPGLREALYLLRRNLKALECKDKMHFLFLRQKTLGMRLSGDGIFQKEPFLSQFLPSPYGLTKPKSEFKKKFDLEATKLLEVDKKKMEEYTLGHNFEKIETIEEFDGQWRDLDGSDNAEEESEALNELNLKHMIRSEDPVHTTVSSDSGSGTVLEVIDNEVPVQSFFYDEWNYKNRAYNKGYCFVQEEIYKEFQPNYASTILSKNLHSFHILKRKMVSLVQDRILKKRLPIGDHVDLDAMVDRYADLIAKVTPSEAVYTRTQKEISNITLFFLIDLSLSTDSWVNGKRILDVERESLLLFSESLEALNIPFQISAFYSRTRNHCKYLRIKSDKESWEDIKNRLGALDPIGYTRIGPALRHTGFLLDKVKTRQKWIILLTDAHPNDYDRYEGKYGTEDINQAVKELKAKGVSIHTLAIGRDEKPAIPQMMREASYQMLVDPKRISDSLHRFFAKAINN